METLAELEGTLDEVSGHLNAQHARLVDVAIAMAEQPSWWCGPGVEQPHRYLAWRTAISLDRAKQVVTIAERAGELPTCMARFRAGELSIDQMPAIAARAPGWVDQQLAALAAELTVSQLRCTLAQYPFPVAGDPDDPSQDDGSEAADDTADDDPSSRDDGGGNDGDTDGRASDEPRDEWVWFGWGDDGRFRMRLETEADTGLVIEQAMRESRDRLFRQLGGTVTMADVMRDIAERSLDKVGSTARRVRYRLNLHLDADGTFTDPVGRALPDAIRRHVCCDGRLSPVFLRGSQPIGAGRTQHIVPPRLRRQVIRRDHGACRVPGCGADTFVEIHHVVHWEDHGVTESHNLICLCPQHHRMHHRGDLGIVGDADRPDGVTFPNRHGLVITPSGARPTPPGAPPPPPNGRYRHPGGERLDSRFVHFSLPPTPAA
jgi:hypothetical protein